MKYHDQENLGVLQTSKEELPIYHKLWAYPVIWFIDLIKGGK